ncbi:hypothetical protein [Iodobacter fluviatilis]|uniref:Ankyrin repeats (3 copies) n=1 Tax=Iodobacter fluviatilis TaxID=537 RepID=A0A377SWE7_9NEIS|nr:hypothetical protein [Iodobacter fluviatilis]TCU85013.1 hypothetical protein EV682_10836 [Iodobacter fluviatilis]STR45303.1 Uncharacterised protein [Iodobacter fluviatilis]
MSKLSKIIIVLAILAIVFVTVPLWLPVVAYGPLIVVSWALGGHCRDAPVLLLLKGEECSRSAESVVTRENANEPVGSPPDCPLVHAMSFNNSVVFSELISKGAKPALCKGGPDRVFEVAANCKHEPEKARQIFAELERIGVRHTDANRLLISQAKENCVPGIELAMMQGADANVVGVEGLAALQYTTRVADDESIAATAVLVRFGADPMRRPSQGNSVYVEARERLHNAGNWSRLESAMTTTTDK